MEKTESGFPFYCEKMENRQNTAMNRAIPDTKGISGSVRVNSLTKTGLATMQRHELRQDAIASVRVDPDGPPPLICNPLGATSLTEAYAEHVAGARVFGGSKTLNDPNRKVALHAFVQFPTDLPLTPDNEQRMLDEAVAFINRTHGGRAVFWARLDRDEKGKHGVDVFYAPRYEKVTARGTKREKRADWVSLTKFGKELAAERFGNRPLERLNEYGDRETVTLKRTGQAATVAVDDPWHQGRALQDAWFEHLQGKMGLTWAVRGRKKASVGPDRVSPEEYKARAEREKAQAAVESLHGKEAEIRKKSRKIGRNIGRRMASLNRRQKMMEARELAQTAQEEELNRRAVVMVEQEQRLRSKESELDFRSQDFDFYRAEIEQTSRFIEAFASGDVVKVLPWPEDPTKLAFQRKRTVSEERRAELVAQWRTMPQHLQESLHTISVERARAESARKEAERAAEQTKKAISEGVQAFWKREITGARQDAAKEWHLAYDPSLPPPRRSALASIVEPVKALVAPIFSFLTTYMRQSRVNISEYAAARRDDDLDIGWDNGPGM